MIQRRAHLLNAIGLAGLIVQGLGCGWLTHHMVVTDQLGRDFAAYRQAFWLMGTQHVVNPWNTLFHAPVLANNGEWMLIPWGLLAGAWLGTHPGAMLDLQTIGLLTAEGLAWMWIRTAARDLPRRTQTWMLILVTLALVADPWVPVAITAGFHTEVAFLPVVVLGSTWIMTRPTIRPAAGIGAVLALLSCGTVGALWGIGIAGTAVFFHHRRWGVVIFGISLGWIVVLGHIGWDHGSVLGGLYHYLWAPAHPPHATVWTVLTAMAAHPGRAWWAVRANAADAIGLTWLPAAWIGMINPLAIGPVLINTGVDLLGNPFIYNHPASPGLQSVAMQPLGLVGLWAWMIPRWHHASARWRSLWLEWVIVAIVAEVLTIGMLAPRFTQVPPHLSAIRQARAVVSPTAPVLASGLISGTFADRSWMGALQQTTAWTLPRGRTTDLVLAIGDPAVVSPRIQRAQLRAALHWPGRTLLFHHDGTWVIGLRSTPAHRVWRWHVSGWTHWPPNMGFRCTPVTCPKG